MKILVTGGAGFIGSHTADLLLKKGYDVRVLDGLEPPVHPKKLKPKYLQKDIEFMLGDIRNRSDMEKALKGVQAVFHLAAYQGYLTDFSMFAMVNDAGTALLYEIIVDKKLPVQKIVLASSQAVYGEGKYQCQTHGIQYPLTRLLAQLQSGDWEVKCPVCQQTMKPLTTDESRVNPHSQYAVSKYAQELWALMLGRKYGIPTVAMRYSITQGARQSFHNAYSGILRIFTVRLLNNLPPVVYEDGKQLRDYVYVGDVAAANVLVFESGKANFEVFNVGGSKATTVMEYARLLNAVLGKNVEPQIRNEFRFGDTRHIISDISKLQKLGWQPKTPLEQIAREYIEWAQQETDGSDHYAEAEKVMKQQGVIRQAD